MMIKRKDIRLMRSVSILILLTLFISANNAAAQGDVPSEVKSIVGMKLEDGQAKLQELGYELCFSSLFGKKQDWFSEANEVCVTVSFKKNKDIAEVVINPETSECQKNLENARKVWENYHDGQAPAKSDKIDEERKKLADQGYQVSYWINDVSPGRSAEYWVNESEKKAKFIVWETQGNVWVMTNDTDYSMGHNPSPNNK
jgi:hypothetical protein